MGEWIVAIAGTLLALLLLVAGYHAHVTRRVARRAETLVPPPGKFIAIDGNRIHYVERGEGRPIRAYLEGTILPAATHWGLSDAYRSELARWLEPNTLGPLKPHPRRRGWRP